MRTHNLSKSREYVTWCNMKARCENPKNDCYAMYAGRGIAICERWQSFENFYADMGPCPDGKSIDRIDNRRGYEPGNCRWADALTQANNTRSVVRLTLNDQTYSISEWARRLNIPFGTIAKRHRDGWPIEQTLSIHRLPRRDIGKRSA